MKPLSLNDYGEILGALQVYEHARAAEEDETAAVRRSKLRRAVRRAVQEDLTDRQREFLLCYYFENQTMPQIAAQYGLNKSTVCRVLARGRERIRRGIKYLL